MKRKRIFCLLIFLLVLFVACMGLLYHQWNNPPQVVAIGQWLY